VRPAGATFVGQRAETERTSEFFSSADNWSRFTAARAGPDGALYVVDMYRLVIEHPTWIPDSWQKVLGDLRAGENAGRIYRVRPRGAQLRPVPRLDRADLPALVAALGSPSGVVRDLAPQQLVWRAATDAAPALVRAAASADRPETRAQALWTLRTLGRLEAGQVLVGLKDPHPGVRRQAVRLSEEFAATRPDLLDAVVGLAGDADAAVLQQVAYTLGEWRGAAAGEALARILRGTGDRFVRAAAMSSALPHAETLLARLRATGPGDDPLLIELATATQNARGLAAILTAIAAPRAPADALAQFRALASLLDWLQRHNKTLRQLPATDDRTMEQGLAAIDGVFADARRIAADATAPLAQREAAVDVLGRGRSAQDADVALVAGLLSPRSPLPLQLAAASALGRMNRPGVAERLLEGWAGHGPALRGSIIGILMSRPAWTQLLLDQAEKDPALLAGIDAGRREALAQHANPKVAERATAILQAGMDRNRQAVIDRYLAAMTPLTGRPREGAGVFAATCASCHRFGAVAGAAIGPDLGSVKDRTAGYLTTHILDPNRAVEERYKLYTATLQDGRTLAGLLESEAGNSVVLRGLDGSEQPILRSEIRMLVSTGRSLMPEGLEGAVTPQAMADLVAYLAGAK
jgi:putative heme-binding domain-containing protein